MKQERGVALLTVITALVALMVIAVPFAITMRLGFERSEHNNARTHAQHQVDSTMRMLEAFLARTTERVEIANRANESSGVNSDPEVDTLDEIQPTLAQMATTLGAVPEKLRNAYGTILGWQVEDENGKINLNGASCFALGNLLGMSVVSTKLSESDRTIAVEDASNFPPRGYVKVGRELISYESKSGNRLMNCTRGVAGSIPFHGAATSHAEGQWVVNYAAWAIAYYPVARHPGEYTPFETLDVTDIGQLTEGLDSKIPVITQADWERVEPHVTVWSKGEVANAWTNIQAVAEGTSLPSGEQDAEKFNFKNSYYFNTGTIIRLSEKAETNVEDEGASLRKAIRPRRYDYGMTFRAKPVANNESQMELFGKVHRKFDGNQMRVQMRTRMPINVNTASYEVIRAMFANLRLKTSPKGDRVTGEEAGRLADAIIKRRESGKPLRSNEDFLKLLGELENRTQTISAHDAQAIYRNALNSSDSDLEFGTAPMAYRTFDVYTLRATATISDRGGRRMARREALRVVEIGSQVTTSRIWESQRDFEEQLIASNDPRYWTSGPINTGQFVRVGIEPWPRWQKQVYRHLFPWDPYDPVKADSEKKAYRTTESNASQEALNGDIRLAPVRMGFDDVPGTGDRPVEHFDNNEYLEGNFVTAGYSLGGLDNALFDATAQNGEMRPFSIQFWWQPQSNASNSVLFDVGEGRFRNRYSCFVDSDENELVFSVADTTNARRAAEIRVNLEEMGGYNQEIWYHIHLVAAGCHPSKMAMIVDGRAVGQSNVLTHLSNNVTTSDTTVPVEDASGFPSQGAVIIGNEVMEYESRNEGGFTIRTNDDGDPLGRGTRGTSAREHINGSPVVLLGYSRPIIETLKTGGATLAGQLGPWSPVLVNTVEDAGDPGTPPFPAYEPAIVIHENMIEVATGSGSPLLNGAMLPLQGGGGETATVTLNIMTVPWEAGTFRGFTLRTYPTDEGENPTVENQSRGFQETGYAYLVYLGGTEDDWATFAEGGSENVRSVAEFVRYTFDGTNLEVERLEDNDNSSSALERDGQNDMVVGYEFIFEGARSGVNAVPIAIVPVSARTTESSNYINPVEEDHLNYWTAQIRSEDDENTAWEWIRYSELLAQSGFSFFVQARIPNELVFTNSVTGAGWRDRVVGNMLSTDVATNPDADDPDGGFDDGDSNPGGGDGDDGGGGGGGGDGGGDGGGGGNTPPPDDTPPPADDDGPGGGNPPPDDTDPPPPEDDGPGGGNPPPPDDAPPPTEDDGEGGGNPPSDDPLPPPPEDDGEGGGNPLPPGEGGPTPDPGGGDPPDDEEDPETPEEDPEGDVDEADDDEGRFISGRAEAVADVLRFRGVQSDRDQDGQVDDWWGENLDGDDAFLPDGSLIVPCAATYGGPGPSINWPRPGNNDDVTLVSGDDESRQGDQLTVFWSMDTLDRRLFDKATLAGTGTIEPFDYDDYLHIWALNDQVTDELAPSEEIDTDSPDFREYNRLMSFPSGEMPDNVDNLSRPVIGSSFGGDSSPGVVDEVLGHARSVRHAWVVSSAEISDEETTISCNPADGTPSVSDVPAAPGVIRIGEELIVYRSVEVDGNSLQFSDCIRGVMRSRARNFRIGTPMEPMFGITVGVLTESATESGNQIVGEGLDRFPRTGVVRLEDPREDRAELRLYTSNESSALSMPIGDTGAGLFIGRYGTVAQTFEAGMPIFWQPVRFWDRFAEYSDNPELSFWSISTELTDAYIKRIYWEEGQFPPNVNVRVVARLNETAPWNAQSQNVIFLSRDGDSSGTSISSRYDSRLKKQNPLSFLRAMEDPQGDNLVNLQADKVECRIFVIFEEGAFNWTDMSAVGWKQSPRLDSFGIEYVQQNRVRRHIDK